AALSLARVAASAAETDGSVARTTDDRAVSICWGLLPCESQPGSAADKSANDARLVEYIRFMRFLRGRVRVSQQQRSGHLCKTAPVQRFHGRHVAILRILRQRRQ